MGVKYTSQSSSGYDSGSPPDNGTTGEDNKCKWSVIKSSLTDVLETFSDAINAQLVAYFDFGTNAISGTYTTLTSDNGKVLEITGSPDVTLGAAATMGAGYVVTFKTVSGTTTAKTSDEIDGSAADRTITAGNSETYRVNAAADKYLIESDKSTSVGQVITARGDIAIGGSTGVPEALTVGSNAQVLTSDGTDVSWSGLGIWTYLDTFSAAAATLGENTSIPSGTTRLLVLFNAVSGSLANDISIELGSGAGPTYSVSSVGTVTVDGGTTALLTSGKAEVTAGAQSDWAEYGEISFTKFNGSNVFTYGGSLTSDGGDACHSSGIVTLVGELTSIKVTIDGGAFDAGSVDVYTY